MSCYYPLKAFYRFLDSGKKDIHFSNSSDIERGYGLDADGHIFPYSIDIPCGQCVGCRLEYSRQWAIRCMLEAQQYEHNYFITLTYNNDNLPRKENPFFSRESGEVFSFFESSSLVPEHLTKFMKDLRRYFDYHFNWQGIRFFACGEYGEKFMRPHFHIILFNCPIPDLVLLKTNFNGDCYWQSSILDKIWDKGFVCVGDCNFDTCAYVARYMMKKQKGLNSSYYDDLGIIPPFTRCSRDPGIAKSYYDAKRDSIYEYDSLNIVGKNGIAKKVKPPKYYDRLYDIDCPEALNRIKDKREASAKNALERKLEHTDLSYDNYLKVCENVFLSKMNKLVRPVE